MEGDASIEGFNLGHDSGEGIFSDRNVMKAQMVDLNIFLEASGGDELRADGFL